MIVDCANWTVGKEATIVALPQVARIYNGHAGDHKGGGKRRCKDTRMHVLYIMEVSYAARNLMRPVE